MHRAVFCKSCGNMIATTDGNEIKIQHRGRTIRVHGSASITCENCKEDTYIDTKCVRRLCGDNATMPACETAMHDAFDIYGNPSSLHYAGAEARKLVEKARSKVAKAINAEPDEIYFTSGATEANIWVLSAFSTVKSNVEHSSMEYGRRGGIVGLESDHLGIVPSNLL